MFFKVSVNSGAIIVMLLFSLPFLTKMQVSCNSQDLSALVKHGNGIYLALGLPALSQALKQVRCCGC